jgi:hypothetical protein
MQIVYAAQELVDERFDELRAPVGDISVVLDDMLKVVDKIRKNNVDRRLLVKRYGWLHYRPDVYN